MQGRGLGMVEVLVLHLGLTASPRRGSRKSEAEPAWENDGGIPFHMINYDGNLSHLCGLWVEEVTGTA